MIGQMHDRWKMVNTIRRDKFDIVLPVAMRENQVDMWIHVVQEGNPDPLSVDLGGYSTNIQLADELEKVAYFIFTDLGEDRIERVVLGGNEGLLSRVGIYDNFGSKSKLTEFVTERDPKKIAVNTSTWVGLSDGISVGCYNELRENLGAKYADRLTSSDKVISRFRDQRVMSEIAVYSQLGETTRQLLEEALSNKVIKPGMTSLEDVTWWIEERATKLGLDLPYQGPEYGPDILHSFVSNETEYTSKQYIIQRGDLIKFDNGFRYMNLSTDFKRLAYVLREGETSLPKGISYGWDQAIRARQVIRNNIVVGKTAEETESTIGKALEEAGFEYIHLTLDPSYGGLPSKDPDEGGEIPGKTWVSIDCHSLGNTGYDVGPCISGFRTDRTDLIIRPNHLFALEFVAGTSIPEIGGRKINFTYEDDVIVTEDGVQWLYPPGDDISLIA